MGNCYPLRHTVSKFNHPLLMSLDSGAQTRINDPIQNHPARIPIVRPEHHPDSRGRPPTLAPLNLPNILLDMVDQHSCTPVVAPVRLLLGKPHWWLFIGRYRRTMARGAGFVMRGEFMRVICSTHELDSERVLVSLSVRERAREMLRSPKCALSRIDLDT
jgi:hypothetical protein